MNLLSLQADVFSLVLLALLVLKIAAFVSALRFPGEAYDAAGKLNKPTWVAILGVAVLVDVLFGLGIFWILSTIAAIVFWVDARPAMKSVLERRW